MKRKSPKNDLLDSLQERAKELNCLYRIDEILCHFNQPLDEVIQKVIEAIPSGWQYPDVCKVRIIIDDVSYTSADFLETPWYHSASILVHDAAIGTIGVYYSEEMPTEDFGCFLREEEKLLRTIADRLGDFIVHQKTKGIADELDLLRRNLSDEKSAEWTVVLEMFKNVDRNLYFDISRKMFAYLCQTGIAKAQRAYHSFVPELTTVAKRKRTLDLTLPEERQPLEVLADFSATAFSLAREHLSDQKTLELIQGWVREEKLMTLAQVLNRNLSLADVADAIRRYQSATPIVPESPSPIQRAIQVSLTRRILSNDLTYIDIAKDYIGISSFHELLQKVIYSSDSHGKIGGKSAGLFLAIQILRAKSGEDDLLGCIRMPRSWYVTSDVLLNFTWQRELKHVMVQKYKNMDQVQLEYPLIQKAFRSAPFPADIGSALAMALDDFGDRPLVVRSSSFLEGQEDVDFAGKYATIFLPNLGSKQERLSALTDAIKEVYASTFGPDPIDFRARQGLLDYDEEMGILIQEVVGMKFGHYFLPAFSGIARCKVDANRFPDHKPEDGLLQLFFGLGSRADQPHDVDRSTIVIPRFAKDYISISDDELTRFSPKTMDVINLQDNCLDTIEVAEFIEQFGAEYLGLQKKASGTKKGRSEGTAETNILSEDQGLALSLAGPLRQTPFIKTISTILLTLEETLRAPVQIEFTSDGQNLYLLQCRRYT